MDWELKLKEMNCTTKECDSIAKNLGRHNHYTTETLTDILLRKSSEEFIPTPQCNILILTDRLYDLGLGLKYYFYKYTNFNVIGVAANYNDAVEMTEKEEVDLLIVCGYQAYDLNYQVISMLRKQMHTNVVMWALLDGLIHSVCVQYNIKYQFSKFEPIQDFVAYLLDNHLVFRASV